MLTLTLSALWLFVFSIKNLSFSDQLYGCHLRIIFQFSLFFYNFVYSQKLGTIRPVWEKIKTIFLTLEKDLKKREIG
jgi:hypothetical protein